ncbi:Asp f 13-like protein [Irpex lacteus]|nr:Asp f 13-like protein [Irpex lacteus]
MQFTFSAVLAVLSLAVVGQCDSVSWDSIYDDAGASLATVACSDGQVVFSRRLHHLRLTPKLPKNRRCTCSWWLGLCRCGTCWQLTYSGKSINVLAVDVGRDGFNLSEEAMNELTGGQAVALGRVDANAIQVDASACGL